MSPTTLGWHRREPPLRVVGVIAEGDVASVLAARLVSDLDSNALDLRIHVSVGVLVALCEAGDLPWVDGATWLGRDGPILCPTTLEPDLPTDLVAKSALRSAGVTGALVLTPSVSFVLAPSLRPPTQHQLASIAEELAAER